MSDFIGLPHIVSTRYRIVIDVSIRNLIGIPENGTVQVIINKSCLQIFPEAPEIKGAIRKDITIGRFNLPVEWAIGNNVTVGSRVFLTATDHGVLVRPSVRQKGR
jgi:hypothetical protein